MTSTRTLVGASSPSAQRRRRHRGRSAAPRRAPIIERVVASVLEQLESNDKPDFTLDVDGVPIKLTNLDKEFWPATDGPSGAHEAAS